VRYLFSLSDSSSFRSSNSTEASVQSQPLRRWTTYPTQNDIKSPRNWNFMLLHGTVFTAVMITFGTQRCRFYGHRELPATITLRHVRIRCQRGEQYIHNSKGSNICIFARLSLSHHCCVDDDYWMAIAKLAQGWKRMSAGRLEPPHMHDERETTGIRIWLTMLDICQ
jgi:hypothetical protein